MLKYVPYSFTDRYIKLGNIKMKNTNNKTARPWKIVSAVLAVALIAVSMKNDWTTIYGDGVTKK